MARATPPTGAFILDAATLVLVAAIVVLDLHALRRTWTSDASGMTASIWTAIIVLLPLVGVVLWMFAGPKFRSAETDPARKI